MNAGFSPRRNSAARAARHPTAYPFAADRNRPEHSGPSEWWSEPFTESESLSTAGIGVARTSPFACEPRRHRLARLISRVMTREHSTEPRSKCRI